MLSDLLRVQGVALAEYADDIAIYCRGSNLREVQACILAQVNLMFNVTQTWEFKLNSEKTKAMLFTRKNVDNPQVKIYNISIDFVRMYNYLGLLTPWFWDGKIILIASEIAVLGR
jgi:hypothetical protein